MFVEILDSIFIFKKREKTASKTHYWPSWIDTTRLFVHWNFPDAIENVEGEGKIKNFSCEQNEMHESWRNLWFLSKQKKKERIIFWTSFDERWKPYGNIWRRMAAKSSLHFMLMFHTEPRHECMHTHKHRHRHTHSRWELKRETRARLQISSWAARDDHDAAMHKKNRKDEEEKNIETRSIRK